MKVENSESKPARSEFILRWVFITIITTLIGAGIGLGVSQIFFCTRKPVVEVLGTIILGGIVGLAVGLAQSFSIDSLVSEPKRWIKANVLGWGSAILLFELNFPISRCFASSNAPRYTPGRWIEFFHHEILLWPAFYLYEVTENIEVYGTIYSIAYGVLAGLCIGMPLGVAYWWAIRKEYTNSLLLLWTNIIVWIIALLGEVILFEGMKMKVLGIGCLIILPPLTNAWVLANMERKSFVANGP